MIDDRSPGGVPPTPDNEQSARRRVAPDDTIYTVPQSILVSDLARAVDPLALLTSANRELTDKEILAAKILAQSGSPLAIGEQIAGLFLRDPRGSESVSKAQVVTIEALAEILAAVAPTWTEFERYQVAERLSFAVYPKFKFSEFGRVWLNDESFKEYYKRYMDYGNWHSYDRKYLVDQMLKLVEHLDGDFVEAGCYRGATAELLCVAAQPKGRRVHLFDSFEGLSVPGEFDGSYWAPGVFSVSVDEISKNLSRFDCCNIYKGWIPDRFKDAPDNPIAFVHIDVDLYQPTWDTLEYFFERVVSGGIIICDDYGTDSCPGAKRAVDDFFAPRKENVASLPTGQGLVIKI
ncbi:TylF/MycF/NovP-related O-methyltransferase [Rhodoplanes azumiensis]|uniref:TylF/MycF/NovP-related O-methyltransferase n=1 Tax=Rhodoplanes azumiensis TaxID=1897628 RepID=A0ABW5AJQ0_9BRAD